MYVSVCLQAKLLCETNNPPDSPDFSWGLFQAKMNKKTRKEKLSAAASIDFPLDSCRKLIVCVFLDAC